MGSVSASSILLHILNAVQLLLGLGLTTAAIWFFIEVQNIASLRNTNHYLLDYNVYWPQAIPWVFLIVGVLVLCVSCCGFVGAKKKSNGLVLMYVSFEVLVVLTLIVAAVLALVFADSKSSDKFVEDAIYDVFGQIRTDREVEQAFGNIEKRMQCCGVVSPRDYKKWRDDFPISCCDTYYHGWIGTYTIDCDSTNKVANERHGCAEVAANYARVTVRALAGVSVFMALIGIMNVIVAVTLSRSLKNKKPRVLIAQHESESKKVLL